VFVHLQQIIFTSCLRIKPQTLNPLPSGHLLEKLFGVPLPVFFRVGCSSPSFLNCAWTVPSGFLLLGGKPTCLRGLLLPLTCLFSGKHGVPHLGGNLLAFVAYYYPFLDGSVLHLLGETYLPSWLTTTPFFGTPANQQGVLRLILCVCFWVGFLEKYLSSCLPVHCPLLTPHFV
jgi:hypothetical protein